MSRKRAAGIVIKDGRVLVMRRVNKGEEYYAFPGGGIEEGETAMEAVARELKEETSILVVPDRLLYRVVWDHGDENLFFLCHYVSGEPFLSPDSEEFLEMQDGQQIYDPMWVGIDQVPALKLYQLEVRDLFLEDYKTGFKDQVQELFLKFSERRQG